MVTGVVTEVVSSSSFVVDGEIREEREEENFVGRLMRELRVDCVG